MCGLKVSRFGEEFAVGAGIVRAVRGHLLMERVNATEINPRLTASKCPTQLPGPTACCQLPRTSSPLLETITAQHGSYVYCHGSCSPSLRALTHLPRCPGCPAQGLLLPPAAAHRLPCRLPGCAAGADDGG